VEDLGESLNAISAVFLPSCGPQPNFNDGFGIMYLRVKIHVTVSTCYGHCDTEKHTVRVTLVMPK